MKKNYQHLSVEALVDKKKNTLEYIAEQEKQLVSTKSILLQLFLTHCIKTAKEDIHLINAELCYRGYNDVAKANGGW